MQSTVVDENRHFNLVAGIAALNSCKVLDINFQERVISLNGTPKAVRACSTELEEVLGRYKNE